MDVKYCRGYRITVNAFPTGPRWRAEVSLCRMKDAQAAQTLINPPPEWSAGTEEEADQYGVAMGKAWIALQSQEDRGATPAELAFEASECAAAEIISANQARGGPTKLETSRERGARFANRRWVLSRPSTTAGP